ncbi:membrane protein [Burkholderia lata]|nr:membrane protein [Burkholderia lata]
MARRSASDATVPVNVTMPSSAIEIPADSRRASTSAVRVPTSGTVRSARTWIRFATTSMGIFLATLVRSMPQFGMLLVLVLLPLQLLSGGLTPRESMPLAVQHIMLAAPTTHFVELAQRILYRGAGLDAVWIPFAVLFAIGCALFLLSLTRFRKTIGQMA